MLAWWLVTIVGASGGVVNALLLDANVLYLPAWSDGADGRRGVDAGFIGNALVGVAAAWLSYTLGIAKLEPLQQAGVALGAAIGGSSFIFEGLRRKEVVEDGKRFNGVEAVVPPPRRGLVRPP